MPTDQRVTEELRDVLDRYAAAWRSGDTEQLVAAYHPDFTLHYFGQNSLAGVHRGKSAALSVLRDFGLRTERSLVSIVSVMAGSERGGLLVRERLGREAPVEVERLFIYRIEGGLLRESWIYDQDQRLIDGLLAS